QQQNFPKPNTPQWLRLTRTGNVFLGETSVDGVNWDFTFTVTMILPSCIEVGLFAQSINVNTTTTAVFSNIMGVPTTPPIPLLVDGRTGNVETQEVLSLFPNPASDEINVKMEAFYGKNVTISVQNQLGQVMLQRDIDEVQDATERIELTNLPSGIYTLTLRTAGQAPVSKQFMVGSARP
ncbi:MAG: T9SS type A sorting domain-containing protein, partial [Saprospiraceae bacterium]